MTQEHKELLLKDLCARLPYGLKYNYGGYDGCDYTMNRIDCNAVDCAFPIENVKLYLFPLSSMTEEEKEEYCQLQQRIIYNSKGVVNEDVTKYINYCYKKHLDINNLITMGLAIDATGLNIY